MAEEIKMIRIGKTALLKVENGIIRAGVVEGHDEATDAKRVRDFGVVVDAEALKAFIGDDTEAPKKKKTSKKEVAESATKE